jgi:hypothetical protein
MTARAVVLAAGAAMAAIEVIATFVEAPYAIVLAALLLAGTLWFWMRPASVWPVALLGLLFALELLYLGDYDWNSDAPMMVLTIVVSGLGLVGVIAWFWQRRGRRGGEHRNGT